MRFSPRKLVLSAVVFSVVLLVAVVLRPATTHAQRNPPPAVAQVGSANPLPVYVVNEPPAVLPDGFNPGTTWKFTSWTVPNNLSFTATVKRTEGAWAYLTLSADSSSRWYYIPYMPGAWEAQ
jgi:hypothetical protein